MKLFMLLGFILISHGVLSAPQGTSDDNSDAVRTLSNEDAPTTTTPSNDDTGVVIVLEDLSNENSNEGSTTSPSSNESAEDNSSTNSPQIVQRFKRDSSRSSQLTDAKDDSDKFPSSETKLKETGRNSSEPTHLKEIILIPVRPRPILIDIIFFRVNRTGTNRTGTGPLSPSMPFGGQGVGHSNHINSDEDTTTTTITPVDATVPNESTTTISNTWSKESHSGDSSNRRRRDTIFSHLTNNSQTDSSEDGKHSSSMVKAPQINSFMSTATVDFDASTKKMPTTPSDNQQAGTTTTATTTTPDSSNLPDVLEETLKMTFFTDNVHDDFNNFNINTTGESKSNETSNTSRNKTAVAREFFKFFLDIVDILVDGRNESKILLVNSDDGNDANSTNRSTVESSATGSDADDNNDDGNGETITTLRSIPPSSFKSNQNSTQMKEKEDGENPVEEIVD